MATPGCLDAGDLDESLRELVAQYPGRWNIIKSRLQSQYVLSSFTTASLEQRWKLITSMMTPKKRCDAPGGAGSEPATMRSPLAELVVDDEPARVGIQERLPILKRRRPEVEQQQALIQPSRPPPSPRTRAPTPPAFPTRCPTFLLAPDSALKAPNVVRRQLKCVYLAQLIRQRVAEEMTRRRGGGSGGDDDDENLSEADSDDDESEDEEDEEDEVAAAESAVSADEKKAVLALLARELVAIQTKPSPSTVASSPASTNGSNEAAAPVTVGGRRVRPPSPPSPLIADQSAALLGKAALISAS